MRTIRYDMEPVNRILLSICIPTYDREKFIGTLLESIPEKYCSQVEICISENPAPGDNTRDLVELYRPRFPHFKYKLQDCDLGFDYNLQYVVQMASGTYCWTIGSDDWLTPDALDIVFEVLQRDSPDLLIANQIAITVNKERQFKKYWLPPAIERYGFYFRDAGSLKEYCRLSGSLSALGAFISSNIFNRQLWLSTAFNREIAAGYVHLNRLNAMLFSPAHGDKRFMYIRQDVVYATIGNDDVLTGRQTAKTRLFLDLNSMAEIADAYISDPQVKTEFLHVLRRQHPLRDLFRTAVIPDCDKGEILLLKRLFPLWQIWICRYFGYRRDHFVHKVLKKVMCFWRLLR